MKLGDVVSSIVIDPRKLTEYALNPDNPRGANKAVMFERHLGFTRDNYQLLLQQIESKALLSETTLQTTDIHGQRYQVDLEIEGIESGQIETVRTGWIVELESDAARLVALYVRKRK